MGSVPRNDSTDRLLVLYEGMLVIRRAEERLQALFADGEVPGFIHLSIGQEAVPVGISASLGSEDTVASNHRGHGHALAKGVDLDGFFRSEEHTSELQSLMRISYAVFCLKKKNVYKTTK